MAVAFDATMPDADGITISGAGPHTYTHTPVDTPTLAIVVTSKRTAQTITGVTYGGNAMTDFHSATNGGIVVQAWKLENPPSGAQEVSITGSGGGLRATAASFTFTGSATSSATSSLQATTGTAVDSPAGLTVTSETGDLVMDALARTETATPGDAPQAGQTERWDSNNTGDNITGYASTEPGAASVGVDVTWVGTTVDHSYIAFNIDQPGAAAPAAFVFPFQFERQPRRRERRR